MSDAIDKAMERARKRLQLPADYPTPQGFTVTDGGQVVNRQGQSLDSYISEQLKKKKAE